MFHGWLVMFRLDKHRDISRYRDVRLSPDQCTLCRDTNMNLVMKQFLVNNFVVVFCEILSELILYILMIPRINIYLHIY